MDTLGTNGGNAEDQAMKDTLAARTGNTFPEDDDKAKNARHDASLAELFTEQAARTPCTIAAVDEASGDFLSYEEVDQISDGIADELRAQRESSDEQVTLANRTNMDKLLGLLGSLKAGFSIPARYATVILWIGEMVTSGKSKTLLLNKGVAWESFECTPACSASAQRGREAGCRSPHPAPPRTVRHLHVIDSVGCSRHIELAAPTTVGIPKSHGQHPEDGCSAALAYLRRSTGPGSGASPRKPSPAFLTRSSPDPAKSSRRAPAATPAPDAPDPRPDGRTITPPHAPAPARVCALTRTEMAVARLVSEGMANKEIADLLVVSVHTVGTHVRSSFAKLNVTNRVALAREIILYDCTQQATRTLA